MPRFLREPTRAPLIKLTDTEVTPFTAAWLLKAGVVKSVGFQSAPPPTDLLRDRYSVGSNPELSRFLREFFWAALCISYQADGEFSLLYPSRDSEKLGWLEGALLCLEDTARAIAAGDLAANYSTIYVAADALDSLEHVGPNDRNGAQFRAFKFCLPELALDLHLLGLSDPHTPEISEAEFDLARETLHWVDEFWISQNIENQLPLLDKAAASSFIEQASTALSDKVSEFNERSNQWTQLASLASLYRVGDPSALMRRAAECLVGYGWRKDLGATDVLDAIQLVHSVDPSRTNGWIAQLTPIIDEITNFTDGDETDHVRSELIDTVSVVMPEYLPSFYTRHISQDEWRYADLTLEAALSTIDLSSKEAAALSGTLLDDQMLSALEKRGATDANAQSLRQKQLEFLGRSDPPASKPEPAEEPSAEEDTALQKDPTKIAPDKFGDVLDLVSGTFPYQQRGEFLGRWLTHWQSQGKASIALKSIKEVFDKHDRYLNAEEILDRAFQVSLAEEGKDAAYPWLAKAHVYRHGWQSY